MRRATVSTIISVTRLRFSQVVGTGSTAWRSLQLRPRSCLCAARTALMWARTPTCPTSDTAVNSAARRRRPPSPSSTPENRICFGHQKQDANRYNNTFHVVFWDYFECLRSLQIYFLFPTVVSYFVSAILIKYEDLPVIITLLTSFIPRSKQLPLCLFSLLYPESISARNVKTLKQYGVKQIYWLSKQGVILFNGR